MSDRNSTNETTQFDAAAHRMQLDSASRRWRAVGLGLGAVVVAAAVISVVVSRRSAGGDHALPDVTDIEPIGSVVLTAAYETGSDVRNLTFYIDAAGEAFYWHDESAPLDIALVGGHWYHEVDGAWVGGRPDDDTRVFVQNLLTIGDGLTIDEALPPSIRQYLRVDDVQREEVAGRAVRHFEMELDDTSFVREANDEVYGAFSRIWGDVVTTDQVDSPIDVWVDDDGWVWRYGSRSDLDSDGFDHTILLASARPFAYPEPQNGGPVQPPELTGSGG